MILRITRQQFVLFLLACMVILGLFYCGYLFVLQPLKQKARLLSSEVATEQTLLTELTDQFGERRQLSKESVVELQKQLPVKPLLDQFLIDLEKAETVSDSTILSIEFGDNENSDNSNNVHSEGESGKVSEQQTGERATSSPQLPDGIKKITATLEVQAASYYQLEEFLEALEGMSRIITIESLSFLGNEELIAIDQSTEPLHYSVKISAFYYPKLAELADQIAELDMPKPAEKTSPLFEIAEQLDHTR